MRSLVIVESPAKAKTISKFLGRNYRVEASYGHVRDLPESSDEIPDEIRAKKWARIGVDIDGDFKPYYVVPREKQKQIRLLKDALKEADEILLATDEDREGESISWHLLEVLKPRVPIRRIVFHEITEEAIREAVANPRTVDMALVQAQESRRILDRLFGYSLSPVLWRKVQSGLSAGRVQSVAVRLIVEREEERLAFRKAEYWDIEATLRDGDAAPFKATLARFDHRRVASGRDFDPGTGALKDGDSVTLLDRAEAEALARHLAAQQPWRVTAVEEKPVTQRPAPPFTTSTLQQEANRKLGFTASRTMKIAQGLYEGVDLGGEERVGLITYMRTDSTTLSEKALRECAATIRGMYGAEYHTGPRQYSTKARNAQEAHEAIRPTDVSRTPAKLEACLDRDELRLYELIWKRTLASQMADARLLRTSVEITAKGEDGREAVFSAGGKAILFPGYLRAYVEGSDDPAAELGDRESILPKLAVGDAIGTGARVTIAAVDARGHETQPPARYTEASLVKKLEEEGIGRPSTYATIIGTVQDRGYVTKQGNALVPTFTAFAVTKLLRQHFGDYVDVGFTARMEEFLDEIAEGKRDPLDFMRQFYRGAQKAPGLAARIESELEKIDFPAIDLGPDPKSGEPLRLRLGRYGPYVQRGEGGAGNVASVPADLTMEDLSAEKAASLIEGRNAGPRVVGTDPKTGLSVYAAKGRFGPYVQLGEGTDGAKPRRASLPPGTSEDTVTLEQALQLLSLPRELGTNPDNGEAVSVGLGRFGPYVKCGRDYRSLAESDDIYTITLERALELLRAEKVIRRRTQAKAEPLRDLGTPAGAKASVRVMEGRYGPYVTDGTTNATIPKGTDPAAITLEQAQALLAEREGAPSRKAKEGAAKKPAAARAEAPAQKPAATRKAAAEKPAARKAAAEKPAARKAPAKKSPRK
jgi:DNA topoisomerase-1